MSRCRPAPRTLSRRADQLADGTLGVGSGPVVIEAENVAGHDQRLAADEDG
jgi:hypothetical protein